MQKASEKKIQNNMKTICKDNEVSCDIILDGKRM